MRKLIDVIIWMLFAIYILVMIRLLFLRPAWAGGGSINVTPFKTIGGMLSLLRQEWGSEHGSSLFRMAFINLLGNVLMFVPLGFFLPGLFSRLRRFRQTLFAAAALLVIVELLQYALSVGACDIDDLILNSAGVTLGYLFFRLPFIQRHFIRSGG